MTTKKINENNKNKTGKNKKLLTTTRNHPTLFSILVSYDFDNHMHTYIFLFIRLFFT